ncbi:family 20 glycosylhydrolase [Bacteroides sp.]|uniref:glycoside hydrolase family 20 protein n=1 Tax=Bacteroides sp. TaxID=29523 RepID=UPI003AB4D472
MRLFKNPLNLIFAAALLLAACETPQELSMIPYPQFEKTTSKTVNLPATVTFSVNLPQPEMDDLLAYLPSYPLPMELSDKNPFVTIEVSEQTDTPSSAEGYKLEISKRGVNIKAKSATGAFYALQTLAQLARNGKKLPVTVIEDEPRFPYRGLHLDVSRHFFDKEHVKKQLDLVATYKINRLHWHLTDGAGWRLEIPGYPRLTEFAAWRKAANLQDWGKYDHHYCEKDEEGAYGGYYTEADVREVLEYARLRHITVIPEIEMPGHSDEVLAAYPQLSCTGEPYTSGEVCIGNEETFKFFEDVLNEVIRLFPSHYIHIGGDEASRRHWKACPKCQKRMKDEGLKDESELQSYMIARIEKYINSKGRDIIGWDEILDGGLAPNATVMSWRDTEGGISAAQMGHYAIMTPGSYCYLDHYQDDPETQPLAFGSYIPIGRTYSYDPAPDSLGTDITKYILGVQGNVWAEYIPTKEHAEYMIYPRIIALAEVGWTPQSKRQPESFKRRINNEIHHIKAKGYNPFMLSEQVKSNQTVDYAKKRIMLSLTSEKYPIDIRYTTDGSEPTASSKLYKKPFAVKDSILLTARLFDGKAPLGKSLRLRTDYHKAIGKQITYAKDGGYYQNKEVYKGGGDTGLLDGLRGGMSYMDGRWQGFCPNDLDATIDLGEVTSIHRVVANFMQVRTPQVFLPAKVEVWASVDGKNFTLLNTDICSEEEAGKDVIFRDFGWIGSPTQARYVRFHAIQGKKQFLFVDEIVIQ